MENKTVKFTFLIFAFLTLFSPGIYSSSKNISFLYLNFERNESYPSEIQAQSAGTIKGSITYSKAPYYFIFKTTFPQVQTMYCNSDGAYILDGNTVTEIPDGTEALEQICADFLNWFKQDLGLKESFFAPNLVWQENNQTVSQWDYQKQDEHPIDSVIVYSDSLGRFTKVNMFMNSVSETPVTSTSLENFEYDTGFYYPSKITSISYEGEEAIIKTELCFSSVSFNKTGKELLTSNIKDTTELLLVADPQSDLSIAHTIESPLTPASPVYRVSIPSVLTNASFKFYKKFITNQDMTNCPFSPSCSQYMLEAVSEYGAAGFFMGLDRLNRCTSTEHKRNMYPTLSNGKHYDPVPPKQNTGSKK